MFIIYTYSIVCYRNYFIAYLYAIMCFYSFPPPSAEILYAIYFGPVTVKIAKKSDEPNQRN